MNGNKILKIDILKIDDIQNHQAILDKLISQQNLKVGMKLKKGETFEIDGQKIVLQQTILALEDSTGKLIYDVFINDENTGKRKLIGEGGFGKVSNVATLLVTEKNGEKTITLEKNEKGEIKERALKSISFETETQKTLVVQS